MHAAVIGAVAGAAGTAVLDATTYADMAVRGRPPSHMPEETVRRLLRRSGARRLGASPEQADPSTQHRQTGLAALAGYGVGIGFALAYGTVNARLVRIPWPVGALVLGLGAMATTDGIALGVGALPRSGSIASWLSDLVPHLVYGVVTATVVAAFDEAS